MSNDIRFLRLLDEVERQGGAHLPGRCTATVIKYPQHTEPFINHDGVGIEVEFHRVDSIKTAHCNREQRFEVPDIVMAGEDFEPRTTTVCYTDDGMAYWPRFAAIHEDA